MFETAELGRTVSKKEFKERIPALRESLLTTQQELRKSAKFPVIVVFAGVDGAGKSETVNLLNEWMDPRWIVTRAYGSPSDEVRERPEFWRYWRDLPPKGRIGFFLSAWYSNPLLQRVHGKLKVGEFEDKLEQVRAFEKTLTDDGALILKFWMHLGKKAQKKRLKFFEKEPLQKWRVTKRDWANWNNYDKFAVTGEKIISLTSTGDCPWFIIEGWDDHYRSLQVAEILLNHMRRCMEIHEAKAGGSPPASEEESKAATPSKTTAESGQATVLSKLNESQKIDAKDYKLQLAKYQSQLNSLQRKARNKKLSTILLFEGWDASGKGGAIRRITAALDARDAQVIPIAAPTDEERAQHYLWRFWRHLPRAGRVTVFDRTWYGRVLVERVEGFAAKDEWHRAYTEINAFERHLIQYGTVLLKFWIHISKDEQLKRFKAREETPFKRWKITEEDWRNREKWDDYETAVHDMVERTSTQIAPWNLIEGNHKRFARVKALRTICDQMEKALD